MLLLLVGVASLSAQMPEDVKLYTIRTQADTIDFIRITNAEDESPRPVLIFLTGSLPIPLIIIDEGVSNICPLSYLDGFDYKELSRRYHIVIISKPNTPVVKNIGELVGDYTVYVPDIAQPDKFDERYLEKNYLEYHVRQTSEVIDYIKQQPWADKDRIILLGHSQGAHVGAHVAMERPDIFAFGYFGGNPMGRFSQSVNEQVSAAKSGKKSAEAAQAEIDDLYRFWEYICRNPKVTLPSGDPAHTWRSFSRQYIDGLAGIKAPVFIAYGTEDPAGKQCVMLPIYFELAGKTDYRMRPFIGRGHDFEAVCPDGSHDYDDRQWGVAMGEFIEWCEKIKTTN
ncbi:MAG: hypothetical protein LBU95_04860 [Rikenellaceae bacterium]|nr:hypothetical protein [Rikenellaceae bacterium]